MKELFCSSEFACEATASYGHAEPKNGTGAPEQDLNARRVSRSQGERLNVQRLLARAERSSARALDKLIGGAA